MNATDPTRSPARRRRLAVALALVSAVATVSACVPAAPAGAPPAPAAAHAKAPAPVPTSKVGDVTLTVGDQKAGVQTLLQAAGELDNLPYKIKWSSFTSGPPLLEAINAGAVDFGTVGNTPPIFSAAAGGKITIVGVSRDSAQGDAVLVPEGSTAKSVADLKGKRVAVAKGSSAQGNLLLQLKKAGLTPSDVKITFLAPADGYAALEAGQIDAWFVWDPYTAQAQHELKARVLADGKGVANGLGFQVASPKALADPERNSAIADLIARSTRARVWAKSHSKEWAAAYSKESGLPISVALTTQRSDDGPLTLTPEIAKSEQDLADTFADAKVIPTRPKIADLIDDRDNETVANEGAK
ncbi:ABC transporter substrate-binding protein [Pengzhenrongella sp.]|jgi:sulfonate transport system substrate-binding protein|uniref:ABC transporter substrate-binding protein n=1 Tax=Pengzhenrongella sp. TaxID=2888820 RepID=UPI002F9538A4